MNTFTGIDERIISIVQAHYPLDGSHGWNSHILPTADCFWYMYLYRPCILELDPQLMLLCIAYHDSGIMLLGRENHETNSANIFLGDYEQFNFEKFGIDHEARTIIFEAIQDHRYSKREERLKKYGRYFRSIYGEILSDCDKGFPATSIRGVIIRAIEYNIENAKQGACLCDIVDKIYDHIRNKYSDCTSVASKYYRNCFYDEIKKKESIVAELTKTQVWHAVAQYLLDCKIANK